MSRDEQEREGSNSLGLCTQEAGKDVPSSKLQRNLPAPPQEGSLQGPRGPAAIHTRDAVFLSSQGVGRWGVRYMPHMIAQVKSMISEVVFKL